MKKTFCVLLGLSISCAFADIYCPSTVICKNEKCNIPIGGFQIDQIGEVDGTYFFQNAIHDGQKQKVACVYKLMAPRKNTCDTSIVSIDPFIDPDGKAPNNNWHPRPNSYISECDALYPQACPFKENK